MSERYRDKTYKWKVAACIVWGAPWVAVSLPFFLSVIGVPIAVLLIGIGAWPWQRLEMRHMERKRTWEQRDHPMPTANEKPWLVDLVMSDDSMLMSEPDA
jgi:hypothetical protein